MARKKRKGKKYLVDVSENMITIRTNDPGLFDPETFRVIDGDRAAAQELWDNEIELVLMSQPDVQVTVGGREDLPRGPRGGRKSDDQRIRIPRRDTPRARPQKKKKKAKKKTAKRKKAKRKTASKK